MLENNCYKCKYQGSVPGSCHSSCQHPLIANQQVVAMMVITMGKNIPAPFNLEYDKYGLQSGWFNWPLDFDPTWLNRCDAYENKD
jgi:hypothetical protein